MVEPPRKKSRTTPPLSETNDAQAEGATPYSSVNTYPYCAICDKGNTSQLRQLAGTLRGQTNTPQQRASSAGPTSAGPHISRTPGTANRTPRLGNRQFPARRGPVTTPHALRALQQRRDAALATGKNRRRSGLGQRETPRDTLRALSRRLAATSEPTAPSPKPVEQRPRRSAALEDFDDGPELQRPRLSMAVDDEDGDDSFHEAPPRLSMALDDADAEDATVHSVEGGRRALSEDPRLSRQSFGRMRLSERFGDLVDIDEDGVELFDDDIAPPILFEDDNDALGDDTVNRFEDDTTQELRAMLEARRQSRLSDINGGVEEVDLDDEPTFRFVMPTGPRTQRQSMPAVDAGAGEEAEAFDQQDEPPSLIEDEQNLYESQPDDEEDEEGITRHPREDSAEASQGQAVNPKKPGAKRKPKDLRLSKFGIKVPDLPSSAVKRLATGLARSSSGAKLSKDAIEEIKSASEWFFEQVSEDLGSYAQHAGRKTIEESDMIALMKRQRQINATTTPFSLAQRHLPRELLHEIRMPPVPKSRSRKRNRLAAIEEDEEE